MILRGVLLLHNVKMTLYPSALLLIFAFYACRNKVDKSNQINHILLIDSVLNKQVTDWNRGDIRAYMDGYLQSDSTRFITSKGITYGWNTIYQQYTKSFQNRDDMGKLTFIIKDKKLLTNNIANITGQWHLSRNKGDAGGFFSLILQLTPDNGWKIIVDHTW